MKIRFRCAFERPSAGAPDDGNLKAEIEPDGNQIDYAYNDLGQETGESWYNASGQLTNTLAYTYDADGNVSTAADDSSGYAYTYDALDRLSTVSNAGTAGVPLVTLTSGYDADGNRTSLSATIDGVQDFKNFLGYNAENLETSVSQQGQSGGDAVAAKLLDFHYDAAGNLTAVDRYSNLAGTSLIAKSSYGYDADNRLTSLDQGNLASSTAYAGYSWSYDNDSRVTLFTNTQHTAEDSTYAYDDASQLTTAAPPTGTTATPSNSLSNSYDPNGNETNSGDVIGAGNRLLSDGTYEFDSELDGVWVVPGPDQLTGVFDTSE